MRKFALMALFLTVFFLGGCATAPNKDALSAVQRGKTAVMFFDGSKTIRYTEDTYLVLAITTVASTSEYTGLWDSELDLSKIHADGLSTLGFNAQSAYDGLGQPEINSLLTEQVEMQKRLQAGGGDLSLSKVISSKLRDSLVARGFDNLIWIKWYGFHLHLPTLGKSPAEQTYTYYWIYDLKKNDDVWHDTIYSKRDAKIDGKSGKIFLEGNNLEGLKRESAALIKGIYYGGNDFQTSLPARLGLDPKK